MSPSLPTGLARLAILLIGVGLPLAPRAQTIVESRGADAAVPYADLTRYGPWDDRNYALTAEDLALLAPNEAELTEPIPAFYRVELRRENPDLRRTGPGQYPRSALPHFLIQYGGYLVEGTLYRRVERVGNRFVLDLTEEGTPQAEFEAQRLTPGSEVRVSSPEGAAESAIAINPVNPMQVIAGANGPGSGQQMFYSTDGGATWNNAAPLPLGGTCCDPTVGWSSDGTKAYASALGGNQVWVYRSADGGMTWDDFETETPGDPRRELDAGPGLDDKQYIHVDLSPTSPYRDYIYVGWHRGNIMQFARSTDRGNTFSAVTSFGADPPGIGNDITSDAAGNVYFFWPDFSSRRIVLKKSTDGGATFEPLVTVASTQGAFDFPLPSMETRNAFIYVSADTDRSPGPYAGSVYAAWTDNTGPDDGGNAANNHGRIQVAYSRDGGATWTVTTPHETADANTVDRYHQWLTVAPDGTVHVVFYDTRRDATRQSVDFFRSSSEDGGQTWSTPERLTDVQSPNLTDGFEFGDYNGMDIVGDQLVTVWTDNRDEDASGGNSQDIYATRVTLSLLPVELTAFDAVADGDDLLLTWETASETANAGFYVEQAEGEGHRELGFVAGAGTTTQARSYAYRVVDLDPGVYRFRLRQVDLDGTTTTSAEIEATVTLAAAYLMRPVYPNPVTDEATLELAVQTEQPVRVEVLDQLGRRVLLLHDGPLAPETVHRFTLDSSGLSAGAYFVRAIGDGFTSTQRITRVE